MKIKRAYYYLFYKFYKLGELAQPPFLSDWKAGIAVIALEIWVLLSVGVYYAVVTKTVIELKISMPIIFIPLALVIILNYFAFVHTDIWKKYVKEFDRLPKHKNKLGNWIVLGVVLFIIGNLIFSFYLMSQVDWSKYR